MNRYNPNIHHRRSIRLKGYDYSQAGLYFITLCCQDRECYFGQIENGEMMLNAAGRIAHQEWLNTANIRDNIALHDFILMPNHFHAIIEILFQKQKGEKEGAPSGIDSDESLSGIDSGESLSEIDSGESLSGSSTGELQFAPTFRSPSQTIGAIIRGYKGATTKKIKELYRSGSNTGELQFAPAGSIWQRDYYEKIIRDQSAYYNISDYIQNNPAKWQADKFNQSGNT